MEPENPSSIPHLLRAAVHRVDVEIQHMLENAHFPASFFTLLDFEDKLEALYEAEPGRAKTHDERYQGP